MDNNILDEIPVNNNQAVGDVVYGGFWTRLGALIIDGLIMTPLSFGLMYFNITNWKSIGVLILVSLISLSYKPVMEIVYGATVGKMAVKLKVVNTNLEKANVTEVLVRNIFNIGFGVITLFLTVGVYSSAGMQEITGYMQYSQYMMDTSPLQLVSWGNSGLMVVETVMLLADNKKRTLHDRIAGTYVIEK